MSQVEGRLIKEIAAVRAQLNLSDARETPASGTIIIGTGTAGRIAEWVTDAHTLQSSTLIKSGAGVLTLSAASAYTVTIPATGTVLMRDTNIAVSRVAFGSDGNTLSGDEDLVWDNTNKRLGIGVAPAAYPLEMAANTTAKIGANLLFNGSLPLPAWSNSVEFNNETGVGFHLRALSVQFDTGPSTGSPAHPTSANMAAFTSSGNLVLGNEAETGAYKLQVNGAQRLNADLHCSVDTGGVIVDYVIGGYKRIGFYKYGGAEAAFVHGSTIPLRFGRVTTSNIDAATYSNFTCELYLGTTGNVGVGTGLDGSGVTYQKLNVNGSLLFVGASSVQEREMAAFTPSYATSTDASRKSKLVGTVWDTAARTFLTAEADGAAAKIGFYGHAAVALQTGVAVSAAGIHAALVALGLITA